MGSYGKIIIILGTFTFFIGYIFSTIGNDVSASKLKEHHKKILEMANKIYGIDLVDPEQSLKEVRKEVMEGYYILLNTKRELPENTGGAISCNNCHFDAGDSLGGQNNGISLVGVTHVYPKYSREKNEVTTLWERVNECFEKSLNGKALSEDSVEMGEILAYLEWISSEIPVRVSVPWLGLPKISMKHDPSIENGKRIYVQYCALCHGENGEGNKNARMSIPPLWGPQSFNQEAGLSTLEKASSFIYYNMPYEEPGLTEEQAIDVAAFIISQPRPKEK